MTTPWPTANDLLHLRTLRLAGVKSDLVEQLAIRLGCLPPRERAVPALAPVECEAAAVARYLHEWRRIKRRFAS